MVDERSQEKLFHLSCITARLYLSSDSSSQPAGYDIFFCHVGFEPMDSNAQRLKRRDVVPSTLDVVIEAGRVEPYEGILQYHTGYALFLFLQRCPRNGQGGFLRYYVFCVGRSESGSQRATTSPPASESWPVRVILCPSLCLRPRSPTCPLSLYLYPPSPPKEAPSTPGRLS